MTWSDDYDQYGNYILDDQGNRIACVYELAEMPKLLAANDAAGRIEALEEAAKDALAHLVAATSLLDRGGKKAAASDKIFDQMLIDYNNSINRVRGILTHGKANEPNEPAAAKTPLGFAPRFSLSGDRG